MIETSSLGSVTQDSAVLIRRFQGGDLQAVGRLFERYYDRVRRIVALRTGGKIRSIAEVDDVVQETFLAAWRSLERFEPREDCRLVHWLARIAERKVLDLVKHEARPKRERARQVSLEDLGGGGGSASSVGFDLPDEATQVIERASRQELAGILDSCMAELEPRQREVVLLRDYCGGSWKFVAEEMECVSEEAARKLYHRARIALATKMQGRV